MSNQSKFPKGAFFNLPHEKAPDFVKGQFNISNKHVFIDWLKSQEGDQVKLSLKSSREGKGYAELDTYVAKGKSESSGNYQGGSPKMGSNVEIGRDFDNMDDDLPF